MVNKQTHNLKIREEMEMKLKDAQDLSLIKLQEFGLRDKGWSFKWKPSAQSLFGQCNYSRKLIFLQPHATALRPREEVHQTILHEIAHALVGPGQHHNKVWKNKAREIGCTRLVATGRSEMSENYAADPELMRLYKEKRYALTIGDPIYARKLRGKIRRYLRRIK